MRNKRRSVCETCRNHKIGCDGNRPACSQCVFTGRKCEGFDAEWTFVPQHYSHASVQRQGQSNLPAWRRDTRSTPLIDPSAEAAKFLQINPPQSGLFELHFLPRFKHDLEDVTAMVKGSYIPSEENLPNDAVLGPRKSRICGAWVEVIPSLLTSSTRPEILWLSTKVLSETINTTDLQRESSQVHTSYLSYHDAIHMVHKYISARSYCLELIPAIMCLVLVEFMFPNSFSAHLFHIRAVGMLFEAWGPSYFRSGAAFGLFQGFRPLIILDSFTQRKPSFLSSDPWVEMPFSVNEPSTMQALLTEAATIPCLLYQNDILLRNQQPPSISEIGNMAHTFSRKLESLASWQTILQRDLSSHWSYYFDHTDIVEIPKIDEPLRFPNITIANCLTYLWAFKIVCLVELERLATSLPLPATPDRDTISGYPNIEQVQTQIRFYSNLILLSLDYLLSDEMKLFGPTSTLFPLRVVYQNFKKDGFQNQDEIKVITKTIERLVEKGLLSAPSLIK